VPAEVAAFLDLPQATSVLSLEASDGRLLARRLGDEGEEVYELGLPALCSVAAPPEGAQVDVAPVESDEGRIAVWTATDLAADARPNDKRFGQSGSPTRVLAVRDVTPERAGERFSDPVQAAERVRALVAERERPASAWDKPERLGEKPGHAYDCWSVVELVEGRPARVSLELLAKGRELAGKLGGANVALVLGHDLDAAARETARRGADVVATVDDRRLSQYEPSVWAAALGRVLELERPHVLLIPATSRGRDYGPRAAGALELGMTGDCVDLGIDRAGRLIQFKPAYGGNIVSVIMGATTPQLATVRPRMFEPLEPHDPADVEHRALVLDDLPEPRSRLVERDASERGFELDEADVVLAVGASVGAEDLTGVRQHADTLGAALGGDRAASEAGLVPPSRQLGLLGRAVAPRLYVAVETEAGYEHAAACVKADVVVSVRAEAAEEAADVFVIGDWRETLPPLAASLAGAL